MCSLLATEPVVSTLSQIIIFMGPPGAGKGTHAGPLAEHLRIPHISTGDLFRHNIRSGTPLGKIANMYIAEGKLVPDELTLDMLFDRLSHDDCQKGCILDGFPRTVPQAEAFEHRLASSIKIAVLHFCIDDAPLIARIVGRLACKQCGTPYHSQFNPPPKYKSTCDRCGGSSINAMTIRKKWSEDGLEVYRLQTKPVIDYYAEKGGVLREICGAGQPNLVFQNVLKAL